jgi:predicted secreted protein
MSLLYASFIYLLIWWVMLFTILPMGVERHDEPGKGFDPGAPKFANLKKKLILNTVVSAVILAVIWLLVELDIIRWREWFDTGAGFA